MPAKKTIPTKAECEESILRERGFISASKKLAFPDDIVPGSPEATLRNGMLGVRVQQRTPAEVDRPRVEAK